MNSECFHYPTLAEHHSHCFLEGSIPCILEYAPEKEKLDFMRFSMEILGKPINISKYWNLISKNWELILKLIDLNLIQINRDFLKDINFYHWVKINQLKSLIEKGLNLDLELFEIGVEIHFEDNSVQTPRQALAKLTNFENLKYFVLGVKKTSYKTQCPICLTEKKTNVVFPCHHSHIICRQCMDNLNDWRCPYCREELVRGD